MTSLPFLWSPSYFHDLPCYFYDLLDSFMISFLFCRSPCYCIFVIPLIFLWSPRQVYDLLDIFMISLLFLWSHWYVHDLLDIFMIFLVFVWPPGYYFLSPSYFHDLPWYFYDLLDSFMISFLFFRSPCYSICVIPLIFLWSPTVDTSMFVISLIFSKSTCYFYDLFDIFMISLIL